MKKTVSIHIDIAELCFVVSRIPHTEKADWLDSFVETLVLQNGKNKFADKLLNDVVEFQRVVSEKAKISANARWHKETNASGCDRMQSDTTVCEPMRSDAKEKRREEKRRTDKKVLNTYTPEFEEFWKAYARKEGKGDKPKALKIWNKLNADDKTKAMRYIPDYIVTCKDTQYMKHAYGYLQGKLWESSVENEDEEQPMIFEVAK